MPALPSSRPPSWRQVGLCSSMASNHPGSAALISPACGSRPSLIPGLTLQGPLKDTVIAGHLSGLVCWPSCMPAAERGSEVPRTLLPFLNTLFGKHCRLAWGLPALTLFSIAEQVAHLAPCAQHWESGLGRQAPGPPRVASMLQHAENLHQAAFAGVSQNCRGGQ